MRARTTGSASTARRSTSVAVSPTGNSHPSWPEWIISAAPPTSGCTTGRPSAIASMAATEKADDVVVVRKAERAAHRRTVARLPVLEVDTVVDDAVPAAEEPARKPVAALALADKDRARRAPEERSVDEHLQALFQRADVGR